MFDEPDRLPDFGEGQRAEKSTASKQQEADVDQKLGLEKALDVVGGLFIQQQQPPLVVLAEALSDSFADLQGSHLPQRREPIKFDFKLYLNSLKFLNPLRNLRCLNIIQNYVK